MPYVKKLKNFKPVGIVVNKSNEKFLKKKKNDKNLLITGGSTSIIKKQLLDLIRLIEKNRIKSINNIFLDPNLFINANQSIFKCADFSINMYQNLEYSICRPGLGVLSELLFNKVIPILIFEENNFEMEYNTKIILEYNLGYILKKNADIYNILEKTDFKENFDNLNFNGIEEITSFFLKFNS